LVWLLLLLLLGLLGQFSLQPLQPVHCQHHSSSWKRLRGHLQQQHHDRQATHHTDSDSVQTPASLTDHQSAMRCPGQAVL
jgi:hypothetical protein